MCYLFIIFLFIVVGRFIARLFSFICAQKLHSNRRYNHREHKTQGREQVIKRVYLDSTQFFDFRSDIRQQHSRLSLFPIFFLLLYADIKNELEKLNSSVEQNVRHTTKQIHDKIHSINNKTEAFPSYFSRLNTAISGASAENVKLHQEVSILETKLEELQKDNERLQTVAHSQQSSMQQVQAVQTKNVDLQQALEALAKEKQQLESDKETLQKEKDDMARERASLQKEKEKLQQEKDGLVKVQEENSGLMLKLEDLQREYNDLLHKPRSPIREFSSATFSDPPTELFTETLGRNTETYNSVLDDSSDEELTEADDLSNGKDSPATPRLNRIPPVMPKMEQRVETPPPQPPSVPEQPKQEIGRVIEGVVE